MVRVVCAYIVENDNFWLKLSLESIMGWIDKVYIIYSPSKKDIDIEFYDMITEFDTERIEIIKSPYEHHYLGANGKQRNKYLEILKEKELNNWCLVLDADEVVDDNGCRIRPELELMETKKIHIGSPRMEHFIYSFYNVDATRELHTCFGRLFKITESLYYDEVEHPLLKGFDRFAEESKHFIPEQLLLYHYGYLRGVENLIKKYRNHINKSNIHSQEFLEEWKNFHLMGTYPTRSFNKSHPKPVRKYFKI